MQLALRHIPLLQLKLLGQSESVVQVEPHIGTGVGVGLGVGVGVGVIVGVGVGQIQVVEDVQLGLRHTPFEHVIPLVQFALVVQELPHWGTAVGVGVGEAATVNSIVQEVKCACGWDSGALGATGACVDVR